MLPDFLTHFVDYVGYVVFRYYDSCKWRWVGTLNVGNFFDILNIHDYICQCIISLYILQ